MIKPYYEEPAGKIYNFDCFEVLKTLPDKSIDLILQDPPYNTTACDWEWDIMTKIDEFWAEWKRVIKDNGAIVMTASQPFTSKLVMSNLKMFKYEWVWGKDRASNFLNAKRHPLRNTESILIFNTKNYYPIMENRGEPSHSIGKSAGKINEGSTQGKRMNVNGNTETNLKYPRTLLMFNVPHPPIHPTQKPVALFEYLIKTYTNEGDTVFDGFLGSGTTAVACKDLNRRFIGCEISQKYVDIAVKRLAQEVLF